jgi:hypothetical protein
MFGPDKNKIKEITHKRSSNQIRRIPTEPKLIMKDIQKRISKYNLKE